LRKSGLLNDKDFYSQERDAADKRLKDMIAGYETEKKSSAMAWGKQAISKKSALRNSYLISRKPNPK
jgi:hypothetical protein